MAPQAYMNSIILSESNEKAKIIIQELDEIYVKLSITYDIDFDKKSLRKCVMELFDRVDLANDYDAINAFRKNLKKTFDFYVPENENIFRCDSLEEYIVDDVVLEEYQEFYREACQTISNKLDEFSSLEKYKFLFNLTLCLITGKNCRYANKKLNFSKAFCKIIYSETYSKNVNSYLENISNRDTANISNRDTANILSKDRKETYIIILIVVNAMLIKQILQ